MHLKPWREIARPHRDVLEGTFKQSEFAADITQVAKGTATDEYQDAEKFFSRTYITEGMRLLLISVAQRLAGLGGDPVVQLQTAFGGGKTHTLLAVYHLASRAVGTDKLNGIPPILDEAGIQDLPYAKVAVIDGIDLSPSQSRQYDGVTVNTLWGELAYRLLGEEGYRIVADSDTDGTSPGKDVLTALIRKAAPCVILIDELVAFIRQLESGKQIKAGTFDSNISFIQALTESLKAVPDAILLATLPESELEAGGDAGQRALHSLEKYFARVENVWKPVGTEESFEIVRRRLFETPGEPTEVEGTSRRFFDFYRQTPDKFPTETQSNEYFERLCRSYPIHPEIFDRLYEDWSTLEKFQRTRGVLQYMALVIHRLWNSDNKDALIMPGSLPLEDSNIRNKSTHYLPQGWEPVIEREVDGDRSVPYGLDAHSTLFGSVQAARRTARTIFLGSAPSTREQMIRGIQIERILLGAAQPGQIIGTFEDVLKRLRDRLHYLYSDKERYWLDTRPNLRREMESRKQSIDEREELLPLLKTRVSAVFGRNHRFGGVHVFTPSTDIPDDYAKGPRLVVLPTADAYSRGKTNQAFTSAENILRNRGDQPRHKQNRLIFLAPDYDVVSRLKEQGRVFLAWKSIVKDIEDGSLNQDISHLNQAKRYLEGADQSLTQLVREAYKWLIAPSEEIIKGKPILSWEAVSISPTAPNLIQTIEEKLREEEWLIYEWSPIHLRKVLSDWYLKAGVEDIGASKVWQDSCHYLYLPRLVNDTVFRNAINQGLESEDFFAFAAGKEDDRYLGFNFGRGTVPNLDESSLLIDREAAIAYRERTQPPPRPTLEPSDSNENTTTPSSKTSDTPTPIPTPDSSGEVKEPSSTATTNRFYGTTTLDPIKAKMDFALIMDEVVEPFTTKLGIDVKISIEIEAKSNTPFNESIQRTVKENCNTLRFLNAEFEQGE
ncbi:MAG: ATP-binding protein [Ectothiorhodospiraceae bacterium AqS1]|nr:ATP-binding protein [Ectothiorhodospiraceae bacterium AqS1]